MRIAWLLSVIAPLAVLILMLAAKPAGAAVAVAPPSEPSAEVEGEYEEWNEGEEEEWEEGEEEEEDDDDEGELATRPYPPDECLLRTATVHAAAKHERLKLTIGYTAYEPVSARVEIRGAGVQGGSVQRHLGRSGVLRITRKLVERPGAERLFVRLRIAGSPPSCGKIQGGTIRVH